MGLEDRNYYQEDERSWQIGFGGAGSGFRSGQGLAGFSAVTLIIVSNAIIFLLDAFSPTIQPGYHWLGQQMALDTTQPWKIWTFITHGFAHASIDSKISIWHIAGNMFVLFMFGNPVEAKLGKKEFVKFYFVAILFSALAFFLVRLLTGIPGSAVGASGAVSAVLILYIFYYPKSTIYFMLVIPMPAWVLGILVIVMDVSRAFDPNSQIAWESHLGGAAFAGLYHQLKWNFSWLKLERLPFLGSRSQVKIHRPSARDAELEREADRILAKVAEEGEASLTGKERRILNKYSKQVRKQRGD